MPKFFIVFVLLLLVGCGDNAPDDVIYDCTGLSIEAQKIMADTISVCWEGGRRGCMSASQETYCKPILRKDLTSYSASTSNDVLGTITENAKTTQAVPND